MLKELIIRHAVTALIASLPPRLLLEGADRILDLVENLVENSDTKIDDEVVLPLIKLIRATFSIPDNDPPASVTRDDLSPRQIL